ncbi:lytic transglycosylase domain-containing protein [Bradyrhizobium monzae]|uniref:lytic transglycosylase domain-containing protein n=1 Tax=Bradyrhizobium sp. Oc8 TaxID=2876780 RepID=UPI001F48B103|nr:lytic transglycosylase domain-containing protein [Bradyrhizobium sp. Oc8]
MFLALTISDAAAFAETRSAEHTASSQTSEPFAPIINEASRRFGLPVYWIRAVLEVESAGDVWAKSPKGAMGLMQIMPQTWAELRLRYQLGNDPYDPHDNILAGAAYLRELQDRYGSAGFLAAYNAGPGRYEEHLAGRALPAETRAYLQKLAPTIGSDISAPAAVARLQPSGATLFAVRSESLKSITSAQRASCWITLRSRALHTTFQPSYPKQPGFFPRALLREVGDERMHKRACISVP